jgi:hypothetical protein
MDRTIAPSRKRIDVALHAAGELEDLFNSLLDQSGDEDGSPPAPIGPPIMRAVAARGRDLARAVLSALDDNVKSVEDIERTVSHG